jgi:hypothetical protein
MDLSEVKQLLQGALDKLAEKDCPEEADRCLYAMDCRVDAFLPLVPLLQFGITKIGL